MSGEPTEPKKKRVRKPPKTKRVRKPGSSGPSGPRGSTGNRYEQDFSVPTRLSSNSKYTPEIHQRLVAAAKSGMRPQRMHLLVDLSETTLNTWRTMGMRGIAPYHDLLSDLNRAEAEFELTLLQAKRRKALGLPRPKHPETGEPLPEPDLAAGEWFLERRFGYSKAVFNVSISASAPQVDLSGLTAENFAKLGRQLAGLDEDMAENVVIDIQVDAPAPLAIDVQPDADIEVWE